jgi:cellulose biosynthesis protein BcsQ
MKILAVYNNKGGGGKTTFSAHLLFLAEEWAINTLGVGLDRQGDLLKWMSKGDAIAKDDAYYERSNHLSIVYSPMQMPKLSGVDLVVVDCPAEVEIALTVDPTMWLVPVHGRLGFENMHNILADLKETKGEVLVVRNNGGRGGQMMDRSLSDALKKTSGITLYPDVIPESDTICRASDFREAAWSVPYANRNQMMTKGAMAMRKLSEFTLGRLGFRKAGKSANIQRVK